MKELTNAEMKQCSFSVLKQLRAVCEENGLRYSLTGGTLLGAVRHQGFIPWDDDIDIMMPRPDYDRLIAIVREGDFGFDLRCAELEGDAYGYSFAKACCRGTRLVEAGIRQTIGVFVDIFPVDGAGDSIRIAKLRAKYFVFLHGLKISSNWTKYHRSKLRKWYYEPLRYGCYLLSKLLGRRFIDRRMVVFLQKKDYASTAYAGRLVGDYGSREIFPRELFENCIPVTFEGEQFSGIADYDVFLTRLYGDYMTMPPAHKQVTHHEFKAYWVD
jgi:lipopolysaccharide cholinephosphotransferase